MQRLTVPAFWPRDAPLAPVDKNLGVPRHGTYERSTNQQTLVARGRWALLVRRQALWGPQPNPAAQVQVLHNCKAKHTRFSEDVAAHVLYHGVDSVVLHVTRLPAGMHCSCSSEARVRPQSCQYASGVCTPGLKIFSGP